MRTKATTVITGGFNPEVSRFIESSVLEFTWRFQGFPWGFYPSFYKVVIYNRCTLFLNASNRIPIWLYGWFGSKDFRSVFSFWTNGLCCVRVLPRDQILLACSSCSSSHIMLLMLGRSSGSLFTHCSMSPRRAPLVTWPIWQWTSWGTGSSLTHISHNSKPKLYTSTWIKRMQA